MSEQSQTEEVSRDEAEILPEEHPEPAFVVFTRRTDDPKLTWLQYQLEQRGIVSRRNGYSFHAPILEVDAEKLVEAWAFLMQPFGVVLSDGAFQGIANLALDDIPDEHPFFRAWEAHVQGLGPNPESASTILYGPNSGYAFDFSKWRGIGQNQMVQLPSGSLETDDLYLAFHFVEGSTQVEALGYDDLGYYIYVRFIEDVPKDVTPSLGMGEYYRYANCGPEMMQDYLEAESKGGWLNQHLKYNPEHPCEHLVVNERQGARIDAGTWEATPMTRPKKKDKE
jgi:hypothetical protein